MRNAMLVSLLAACGGDPEPIECPIGYIESDGLCTIDMAGICDDGFELAEDGMCYPAEQDPADAVRAAMDAWPDCEPGTGDGRLDLSEGCADGVCVGSTYEEIVESEGEGLCEGDGYGYVLCSFENGAGIYFQSDDTNTPAGLAYTLVVFPGYGGHDGAGLGSGISMACWSEQLGLSPSIEFRPDGADYYITSMYFYEPYVRVWDYLDGSDYGQDGMADYVYVYGQ